MVIDEVRALLGAYVDVREKDCAGLAGWYVRDRLVARQLDDDLLVALHLRRDRERRRMVLEQPLASVEVRPHQHAVGVELPAADPEGVRRALAEAVELQRNR